MRWPPRVCRGARWGSSASGWRWIPAWRTVIASSSTARSRWIRKKRAGAGRAASLLAELRDRLLRAVELGGDLRVVEEDSLALRVGGAQALAGLDRADLGL